MATQNKFNDASRQMLMGTHDWDTHTWKVYLSNAAPAATDTIRGTPAEITAQNGYAAGGPTVVISSVALVTGSTARVTAADPTILTATGAVGPFQYVVLYNDTSTSPVDALWSWWNYGSAVTLANTETFTYDFDQANGLFDWG